eukprot:1603600-Heterocapsa_arctica.AAC.1
MYKPPGARDASEKPDAAAKAKAKAKAKAQAAAGGNPTPWCRKFLTEGGCPKSAADCDRSHLDEASVKRIQEKQAKAKAKAAAGP